MKQNKKSVTVGVQELSSSDIKKREATYREDLSNFRGGLIAGERFKADGIRKLAKDLEKAETIETHKISARIKSDLKDIIEKRFLTLDYVAMVLDEKYKQIQKGHDNTNKGRNITSNQNQSTETTTSTQTGESQTGTIEGQGQVSQKVKDIQKHETLAQEILGYTMAVTQKITGCTEDEILKFSKDYRALTSQTKDYRFELTKKFSDLNLKTVYDVSRMLFTVLDNFLKQLDDELDSRKNKEALTSE